MNDPLNDLLDGIVPDAVLSNLNVDLAPIQNTVPLALPLFDYQREAVKHVLRGSNMLDPLNPAQVTSFGAGHSYVALDMGLGKTPVGIALAAAAAAVRDTPVLVSVPPSLRFNWRREFAKFAPQLSVEVLEGAKPTAGWEAPAVDVLLLGDSQLMGWHETLMGKVHDFIVDEAHRLKNKSRRTLAMVALAETCRGMRVLMSGTPFPNGRHTELAMQLDILGPEAWAAIGGKTKFYTHFAPVVNDMGARGNSHEKELHEALVSSFFFRRLRSEVLDLPNKGRTAISVEGTGKAKRDYVRVEDDLIQWLAEEGLNWRGAAKAEALVRLSTLRRLAGLSKTRGIVDHVKSILDEVPGGVFIVAEHRPTIDNLLDGLGMFSPVVFRGGMSDKAKEASVDQFTSGRARVMIGQIAAAGVGLTLHGGGINHRVVIAQIPWTPSDLKQAEDRLHRIGQTHDVEVEVCMAAIEGRWTIDERLWGQLEDKAFSAGEMTDGEGEVLLEEIVGGVLDSYR